MINRNKKIKMKGFTLVELLAVIVILAIILVIAVPKVMDIINDAKKGTLESSAKMIANQAEKQKIQNTVLGNDKEITFNSIANLNKGDYSSCSIKFEDNTALVTIEGSGKFEGFWICDGTKTDATATEGECNSSSSSKVCLIDAQEEKYNVNVDNCVTHLKSLLEEWDEEEYTNEEAREICQRDESIADGKSIHKYLSIFLDEEWITEEELIEKNIANEQILDICITDETPENCFIYVQDQVEYSLENSENCINYTADSLNDFYGFEGSEANTLCNTGTYDMDEEGKITIIEALNFLIKNNYFTKQDLIDNNVLSIKDELTITGYNTSCPLDNVVVPNMINNLKVTKIGENAFSECDDEECYPLPIKRIRFRENITYIPDSLFEYGSLEYVYVENFDAEIGNCAFGYIEEDNEANYYIPNTYECEGE